MLYKCCFSVNSSHVFYFLLFFNLSLIFRVFYVLERLAQASFYEVLHKVAVYDPGDAEVTVFRTCLFPVPLQSSQLSLQMQPKTHVLKETFPAVFLPLLLPRSHISLPLSHGTEGEQVRQSFYGVWEIQISLMK